MVVFDRWSVSLLQIRFDLSKVYIVRLDPSSRGLKSCSAALVELEKIIINKKYLIMVFTFNVKV